MLSGVYDEGMMGVEKNPDLGACLDRIYDPGKNEVTLIAGRAWGCGLRVADPPE